MKSNRPQGYIIRLSFLIVAVIGFSINTFCQAKTDSLLNVYNSSKADSSRLKALNTLFLSYQASNDSLAAKYSAMAISFGAASKDAKGYATALYQKGQYEGRHGHFDNSEIYLKQAIKQFTAINDNKGLASCNMGFGLNLYDQSKFKEALSYFLKALKLREQIKDQKGIATSYTWIGNVYNTGLFKPNESIEYYDNALKIYSELNDEKGLASTYNNLGNVNYFLKKYKEALSFYERSSVLKEKLNDKKGLSNTFNNLGNVSAALKDFNKAIDYFNRALAIYEEFGDQAGVVSEYINMGNVCFDQKNYSRSIEYNLKAFQLAKEIGYREGLREASYALAISYEDDHNIAKALEYFKFSTAMNDSILNKDFNDQIVEMDTKYQTNKKELENKELKSLNTIKELELSRQKQQNFIKTIIIISVLILLILGAFVGYLYIRKRKIQQKAELDAEIATQKEIRIKSIIEAEEKERRRIAQDLHDGVGQILSAAKLNLSGLEAQINLTDPNKKEAFKNALDLIDDSVKEVRLVSHNMMPNTLIKLGLASAVKEFITKIGNVPNLKVDLEIVGLDKRIEENIETVLYRVIQEVIANIIKHAKATEISLQLIKHEKELSIIIEDNGVGFDTSKINTFEGIGLKNIISRIEFVNGTVHFDSTINRGTTVVIEVGTV
ncbi:MAG: sensor histidine kinase [Bacteroidia bacterium]